MPPPTASLKPSSGSGSKTAQATAADASKSNGQTTDKSGQPRLTKPDQAAYNAQMDALNKEIEGVKAELVSFDVRGNWVCGAQMGGRAGWRRWVKNPDDRNKRGGTCERAVEGRSRLWCASGCFGFEQPSLRPSLIA